MRRGDVREVDLPNQGGKELRGPHPAIIVQNEKLFGPYHDFTIVVPLTSNLDRGSLPECHKIEKSSQNGLSSDSVALVPQVRCVDRAKIRGGRWGYISDADMQKIDASLRVVLAL